MSAHERSKTCRRVFEDTACRHPAPQDPYPIGRLEDAHRMWLRQIDAVELLEDITSRRRPVPAEMQFEGRMGFDLLTQVGHFPVALAEYLGRRIYPAVKVLCVHPSANTELRSFEDKALARLDGIVNQCDRHLSTTQQALKPDAERGIPLKALRANRWLLQDAIMFADDFRAVEATHYKRLWAA